VEEAELLTYVRAAGLETALRDFPEDVVAAAGAAEKARGDSSPPADPASEPWPPMRSMPAP
jgi:hypothetical protein